MAGHAEVVRGNDRAASIMKYEGLPGKNKPVIQEFKKPTEIPVMGGFVSTLSPGGVDVLSPFSAVSEIGDHTQKPKFTAKIVLFDSHSDDNF